MRIVLDERRLPLNFLDGEKNVYALFGKIFDSTTVKIKHIIATKHLNESDILACEVKNDFQLSNDKFLGFLFPYNAQPSDVVDVLKSMSILSDETIVIHIENGEFTGKLFTKGQYIEVVPIIVIPKGDKFFERIKGIVDVSYLAKKKVVIVGLGTGGSLLALELVKAGVGQLSLFDYDIVEVENIVRHVCTLEDVGRCKTLAVKDILEKINPECSIQTFEIDIRKEPDTFEMEVKSSDLLLESTGVPEVCSFVNEACVKNKKTAIFGGAYERGCGGYLMRYIPDKTPCYNCVFDTINQSGPNWSLSEEQRRLYTEITDTSELKAEPGLSIDVGLLTLVFARMALLTLLRETETSLTDFKRDFIFWANEPWGDLFNKPVSYKLVKTNLNPECPICQRKTWINQTMKDLGIERISDQEIEDEAETILSRL